MLDHLLALPPEPHDVAASSFVPLEKAGAQEILNAKISTNEWLKSLGADDEPAVDPAYESALATHAFGAVTGVVPLTLEQQKEKVLSLRTHESVRKAAQMLTQYEFSFVEKAQELRGYIVTKLLDEVETTKNPTIKLKALKMLGDVTEVGLFTTRVETTTRDLSNEQIDAEIKKRLERLTLNPDTPLVTRIDTEVDDA